MTRQTIRSNTIKMMQEQGYKLIGETTGQPSTKSKASNLSHLLKQLGCTPDEVVIKTGARAGQHWNDGYQIMVFKLADPTVIRVIMPKD